MKLEKSLFKIKFVKPNKSSNFVITFAKIELWNYQ